MDMFGPDASKEAMTRIKYLPEDCGKEVVAPSGYYQPVELGLMEYAGHQALYTLGAACIEASCCGVGSWKYVRVEGIVLGDGSPVLESGGEPLDIDTIEDDETKRAIRKLILERHPDARVEFR
jgi:hypothetical protein